MTSYRPIAAAAIALMIAANPVIAQEIEYSRGQYEYAVPAAEGEQQAAPEIIFSPSPTVQPIETIAVPASTAEPAITHIPATPAVAHTPERPVIVAQPVEPASVPTAYAYPANPRTGPGAARVIYRNAERYPTTTPTYGYVQQPNYAAGPALPPGARLVEFNREDWLGQCHERLTRHHDFKKREDRLRASDAAMAECTTYLDDYMARAAAGAVAQPQAAYGQEYMLVPVTIAVPQELRPVD